MVLSESDVKVALGGRDLSQVEKDVLDTVRRFNIKYGELSKEFWYANIRQAKAGLKILTLPEFLDHEGVGGDYFTWCFGKERTAVIRNGLRSVVIGDYLLEPVKEKLDIRVDSNLEELRVVGELRRWGARQLGTFTNQLVYTPELIPRYCSAHHCETLEPLMRRALPE